MTMWLKLLFFKNCHDFFTTFCVTGSGIVGSLDSNNNMAYSRQLRAYLDAVVLYLCFQIIVLKAQFFIVTVQLDDLFLVLHHAVFHCSAPVFQVWQLECKIHKKALMCLLFLFVVFVVCDSFP